MEYRRVERLDWSEDQHGSVVRMPVPDAAWSVTVHHEPPPVWSAWAALELEGHSTAFQRREWAGLWYAHAAAAGLAKPLIAMAHRPGDPVPVLLLPLCTVREHNVRVIEFAGLGLSDYRAPVIASTARLTDDHAVEALKATLAAVDGDLLRFSGIVPTVGGRQNPLAAIANVTSTMGAHAVPLSPRPEATRSAASFARDLDRLLRKLGRERGTPRLVVATTDADARRLFDGMMALRRRRFDALGRDDALDDPTLQAFYDAVFTTDPSGAFGMMIGLEVDGEIVAADACVRHGGALHVLAGSFRQDDGWHRYGLGNLLTQMELDWAAAEGLHTLDLTIGDESYKSRFGADRVPLMELHAARSLRAVPSWAAWRAKSAIRQSPPLLNAARSMQIWISRTSEATATKAVPILQAAGETLIV